MREVRQNRNLVKVSAAREVWDFSIHSLCTDLFLCLIKTTLDLIYIDFLKTVMTDVAMYELRWYYLQIPEILRNGGQE